ncbi:glutaredoxin-3 [Bacillus rossius redtenbacheri]|uniref:glutaredoxin-3 n=1 Tax=Bacillus rossius redtenbacheri TaxID=93214 RepID=UPI002FDCFA36
MGVTEVTKKEEFEDTIRAHGLVVAHFYADWAAQCAPMNEVISELAKQTEYKDVRFVKCPAEDVPEVSLSLGIKAVPTFLLLRGGSVVDRVDGADAAALSKKISQQVAKLPLETPRPAAESQEELTARLRRLVSSAPVMLFMKGSREQPRCGFSRTIIALLDELGADYATFDILGDEAVRQGLKKYSDWPTYPQLYVKGELIGGLDVVREMRESGELEKMLPKKQARPSENGLSDTPGKKQLEERLRGLIGGSKVMVFMKGDRDNPRCGFSRQLMQILSDTGVEFGTFDVLSDDEVRQGLKELSDWPTYPQVYVKGELIGGVDIVKQLAESGELSSALSG